MKLKSAFTSFPFSIPLFYKKDLLTPETNLLKYSDSAHYELNKLDIAIEALRLYADAPDSFDGGAWARDALLKIFNGGL